MGDQAEPLRELMETYRERARVYAVTSGKGGVGKTNTSVNLAIALAATGKRVTLMDVDLGLANVEVLLGLSNRYTIEHVVNGTHEVADIVVRGPGGISLIPGCSGLAQVADLAASARRRLLDGIQEIHEQHDVLILDTMAGIGRNAVSFAAAADEVLLVTTPEPSAIVDAYAMLKTIYLNRSDAIVRLIVNMCASPAQAEAVGEKLAGVSQQYLGRNLSVLGYVPRDPQVAQAVMQSKPFTLAYPHANATKAVHGLAQRLARLSPKKHEAQQREGFLQRFAASFGFASSVR